MTARSQKSVYSSSDIGDSVGYLWGFRPKTIAGFRVGDVDVGDSVTRLQVAWEKTTRKSTDQVLRSPLTQASEVLMVNRS